MSRRDLFWLLLLPVWVLITSGLFVLLHLVVSSHCFFGG